MLIHTGHADTHFGHNSTYLDFFVDGLQLFRQGYDRLPLLRRYQLITTLILEQKENNRE